MIPAERVKILTKLSATDLTAGIRQTGYKKDQFDTAKFLGISNGSEFVYSATFVKDGEEHLARVYVRYDNSADRIVMDY